MMIEKDAKTEARLKESEAKLAKKMKVENETRLKEAKAEFEEWMNANF